MPSSKRVITVAAIAVGILLIGEILDQIIGRGMPGPRFDTIHDVLYEAERVAVTLAVIAAWIVTPTKRAALVGLGLAAGLLAIGLVWPFAFLLAPAAGYFTVPLIVAMLVRLVVNSSRARRDTTPAATGP